MVTKTHVLFIALSVVLWLAACVLIYGDKGLTRHAGTALVRGYKGKSLLVQLLHQQDEQIYVCHKPRQERRYFPGEMITVRYRSNGKRIVWVAMENHISNRLSSLQYILVYMATAILALILAVFISGLL